MLKFFFFSLLLLLSLPGITQEENQISPLSQTGGHVTIRNSVPSQPKADTPPTPTQDQNEDSSVRELEAIHQEQRDKIQKIEKTIEPLKDPILNPIEEIKKLGHKQIDAVSLMDEKVLAILQKTLDQGILAKLSAQELKEMILKNNKGTFLGDFLSASPKFLDFFVDVLRDKNALIGLIGILVRKEDLKNYGYICLVIFIFGLYIKTRIIKPKWSFIRRTFWGLSFSLVMSSISLYLFYNSFSEEVKPTLSIAFKHLSGSKT